MTHIYSVPAELHIMADSVEDALEIAAFMPSTVHTNEGTSVSVYVATDDPGDVETVE